MANVVLGTATSQAMDVLQSASAALAAGRLMVGRFIALTADPSGIHVLAPATELATLVYFASILMQEIGLIHQNLVGDRRLTETEVGAFVNFFSINHPNAMNIIRSHIHSVAEAINMQRDQHDAARAAQVAQATAANQPVPAAAPFVPARFPAGATHYFDLPGLRGNMAAYEVGVPLLAAAVNMVIVEAVAIQMALINWKLAKLNYNPDVPVSQTCTMSTLKQPLMVARAIVLSVVGQDAQTQLALRHVAATQESKSLDLPSIPGIGSTTTAYATSAHASNVAAAAGKATKADKVKTTGLQGVVGPNNARNRASKAARKEKKAAAAAATKV